MKSKGNLIRQELLDKYYTQVYADYLFGQSFQARGIDYFEKFLEKHWKIPNSEIGKVLEIGFGSGEHLPFVKYVPQKQYVGLDLRESDYSKAVSQMSTEFASRFSFKQGDAQNIDFPNAYFDRTFSTCLLHHVNEPLDVLLEARRVTRPGGEISFTLPTDPGLANQVAKKLISAPRMKKISNVDPWLIYSLEHRNHVNGLLHLIRYVFKDDDLTLHYGPLRIPSWNFNLVITAHVLKRH